MRDGAGVRSALAATTGLRGQWIRMVRMTATGVLAALDGDEDAPAHIRATLDLWTAAGLPLDHASATLCALRVLPPTDAPQDDVDRARAYLTGLQATSMLRLYDAATA